MDSMQADMAVLKEDVAVLKEDVSGLKEDVSGLKEDVSGLKEDVANLTESQEETRSGVNALLEWAEECGNVIKFPLPKVKYR